jgi:hypothetical protein
MPLRANYNLPSITAIAIKGFSHVIFPWAVASLQSLFMGSSNAKALTL